VSNVYLNSFDHHMAHCGYKLVRYADDFVILCQTQAEAERALEEVKRWMAGAKLSLHPEKTRIVDATQRGGFDFLGYHFERGYQSPSSKSVRRFKATLRHKTRRTQGRSLRAVIDDVNQTAVGWWQYHQLSSRWAFKDLDKWLRMRLRSILRKQQKKRGRGRGVDHQLWPNRFFLDQGLFFLYAASAVVHPPSWR
jgi:RNA-directed DNA polymerase